MKVYALTQGDYSDYHIVGLFSSHEKAEEAGRLIKDPMIEEYELDVLMKEVDFYDKGYRTYFCIITKEGGLLGVNKSDEFKMNTNAGINVRGELYAYINARSENHAIQKMNDFRACVLANNMWRSGSWSGSPKERVKRWFDKFYRLHHEWNKKELELDEHS